MPLHHPHPHPQHHDQYRGQGPASPNDCQRRKHKQKKGPDTFNFPLHMIQKPNPSPVSPPRPPSCRLCSHSLHPLCISDDAVMGPTMQKLNRRAKTTVAAATAAITITFLPDENVPFTAPPAPLLQPVQPVPGLYQTKHSVTLPRAFMARLEQRGVVCLDC
jgi:hypothetical protein